MHTTADEQAWPTPEETPSESNGEPSANTHVIGRLRPSLASLMAETGVASQEQLQQALAEGQQTGERLGEVVLRHGWINEADLANLIARQWDLTFAALSMIKVDEHALSLLSRDEAAHLGACPVGFDENRPLVAIADPSEDRFAAVRERLGANCAFLVTTKSALARLVEQAGSSSVEPQVEQQAEHRAEHQGEPQVEHSPDVEPVADVEPEHQVESSFDDEPVSEPEPMPAFAELEDNSSPAVEQLDRLIERLVDEHVNARDELSRTQQHLAETSEEQARAQQHLAELNEEHARAQQRLSDLNDEQARAQQRVAELDDDQAHTRESIRTLEARLGQEDQMLARVRAKLGDLNGH